MNEVIDKDGTILIDTDNGIQTLENIETFDDHTKFVKMSEINAVVKGFSSAKAIIQGHLIQLYKILP